MLRYLGAAYYNSLNGHEEPGEVTRAVDEVSRELAGGSGGGSGSIELPEPWRGRVGDVMTTPVVSADGGLRYRDIAKLLVAHRINAVPVVVDGRLAGVVSEADLMSARNGRRRWRARFAKPGATPGATPRRYAQLTAGELMTSPAVTVGPDTTISDAASIMIRRHLRRLPVLTDDGALVGLVSRRDLLTVLLAGERDETTETTATVQAGLPADRGAADRRRRAAKQSAGDHRS
jgi:CBS domain-containing protein